MDTIIRALIGAGVAIFLGVWQINLTRKSLESANRPYVTIFNKVLNIVRLIEFIVIKNSGNVPAKIENIIFEES